MGWEDVFFLLIVVAFLGCLVWASKSSSYLGEFIKDCEGRGGIAIKILSENEPACIIENNELVRRGDLDK
jgi:hypothetical protein